MSNVEKYLKKLENDVAEQLYDLLIMHLLNVDKKVLHTASQKDNMDHLLLILNTALDKLSENTNNYNRLQNFRYMILICNTILRYDKNRADIKEMKKRLVEDYIQSDEHAEGIIPLNYQINEIRLTYSSDYLTYLIKKFISQKDFIRALYCLTAVEIVEPDLEDIDKYYEIITKSLPEENVESLSFNNPKGKLLLIDSNIAISMLMYDTADYNIKANKIAGFEEIKQNNKIVISPTTAKEMQEHLTYELINIKKRCFEARSDCFEGVKSELNERYDSLIKSYGLSGINSDEGLKKDILSFYAKYPLTLRKITMEKIAHKHMSKTLRKLAQRENFLPEDGDISLLSEAISLKKKGENDVAILSNDKDFTVFAKLIYEKFGIEIYSV